MKEFTDHLIVKNEAIIKFLAWAEKQPKGQGKVILVGEEVPEPRS